MTKDVNDAPAPDSDRFLEDQNTVEKVSPGTTADAPATDPELIGTDPAATDQGSAAPADGPESDRPGGDITDHGADPDARG